MAFKRGDTLLVPFPFSDLSGSKARPAVVISSVLYHREEPDLILAGITTKLTGSGGPFDYILKDWKTAGLRFPSALKPVVFTLDPTHVIYHIGALSPTDLVEVDRRLRLTLAL